MREAQYDQLAVTVENLGGIRSEQLSLHNGVSVLTGRNATNRTSLLRALGAGLGGSTGELKADADEGSVALSFGDGTHTRTFEREGQSVRVGGEPYTEDGTLVDQYATLLADNPARRAVERGDSDALRECIMAPVDTDELKATIRETRNDIESLREEVEAARRQRERVPSLERELAQRREELDGVTAELESIREAVAAFEADVEDAKAAETVVETLQSVRQEYERVSDQRRTQRKALESLREERARVVAELDEIAGADTDRTELEADVERRQRRERELTNTINNLRSIVEFNEQLTDAEYDDAAADSVTDRLTPETETVECWTCGTAVERGQIDAQLDSLRDVIQEKRQERTEIQGEIETLRSELSTLRERADRRESLEADVADIDGEIADREARLEDLDGRAEKLEARIEELEREAAESDDLRDGDLLEKYQRLSEREYERGQLEQQVESLETELATARETAEQVATLEARLDDREAALSAARTRIEELERAAIETFNEHMETTLGLLGYDNVERVWIERKVSESADRFAESDFDLHVVRTTDEDVAYEDTIAHLSESEREVIGFVVALAGYLVHEVHETVPVMLLDSLEAIDSDRIAALVDHFADFVPFLVVALLPEDAAALADRHDRIRMGKAPV